MYSPGESKQTGVLRDERGLALSLRTVVMLVVFVLAATAAVGFVQLTGTGVSVAEHGLRYLDGLLNSGGTVLP